MLAQTDGSSHICIIGAGVEDIRVTNESSSSSLKRSRYYVKNRQRFFYLMNHLPRTVHLFQTRYWMSALLVLLCVGLRHRVHTHTEQERGMII